MCLQSVCDKCCIIGLNDDDVLNLIHQTVNDEGGGKPIIQGRGVVGSLNCFPIFTLVD